ncbi:MAG: RNA methyltransferase, partial [Pseudolabrys sp.]
MTEQLTIARIGHRGDGIADTNAGPVFVPYTLPGEIITVERADGHPDRRHLVHVEKASHERETPICKHFGQCGGCAMQHWSLAEYHIWKRGLVVEALAQANLIAPVDESIIDAHGAGRRRATLHARRGNGDILEVGFSAPRAHHVIAIDRCPILAPSLNDAIEAAWAVAEVLKPTKKPLDIQVTATDSGMDMDVRGSGPLSSQKTTVLADLAAKHKLARLTRHGELVVQSSQPLLKVGRAYVALPP